ncbi:uncharacterized protein MAM_07053 [Metarhizium album ARSEF 1941]|uniref:DUF7729 domain-containing protein n=1 Tax=Metarhizium album (strain ARSEF 1941) TaxID=1081103 RepID=A0A0B2WMJ0_METAS|nr:uncharacterized protein MAM_07053 [Metarhizium album ARSEF 1941]KHN95168.1 hypothetical protein MAM_07053 [Metarhizium album ARSEF 1941]
MTTSAPVTISPTAGESERLGKRQGNSKNASAEAGQSEESTLDTDSLTSSKETTTSSATTTTTTSPLPSPFGSLAQNAFQVRGSDDSCPNFMAALLSDPTFKRCYPISMMIKSSISFFDAEKELVSIVKVLDATCAADVTKCTKYMTQAAQNLTTNGNCKREFDQNQTQVVQAWQGLKAYKVLYSATCLQDPSSNSYCYANAVTNFTNPSDVYFYFMPFGQPLIASATPSCNWCIQNTMSIYQSASADRQQLLTPTYQAAANLLNARCGPDFVNSTLPAAENGAFVVAVPSHIAMAANLVVALFLLARFL